MRSRSSKVLLILLLALPLAMTATHATSDQAVDPENCDAPSGYVHRLPNKLSSALRAQGQQLLDRAREMANGMLRIESILQANGVSQRQIIEDQLAWVGVLGHDYYQIGLYSGSVESLTLLQMIRRDPNDSLSDRFELAQQALMVTPQDCGLSFGVMDIGLTDESDSLIHSIRLVDRSRDLAWGMHYRYRVAQGRLAHVDRLHVRCIVAEDIVEKLRPEVLPDAKIFISESLPGMALPTEAQLMQLYLYPDFPDRLAFWFWTDRRLYELFKTDDTFPDEYTPGKNPCSLVEPTDQSES